MLVKVPMRPASGSSGPMWDPPRTWPRRGTPSSSLRQPVRWSVGTWVPLRSSGDRSRNSAANSAGRCPSSCCPHVPAQGETGRTGLGLQLDTKTYGPEGGFPQTALGAWDLDSQDAGGQSAPWGAWGETCQGRRVGALDGLTHLPGPRCPGQGGVTPWDQRTASLLTAPEHQGLQVSCHPLQAKWPHGIHFSSPLLALLQRPPPHPRCH